MNTLTQPVPPLAVIARETDPDTGIEHKEAIARALAEVLGDTYVLILKTHIAHWNVEGPLFYSVHNLTEDQYKNMFSAADVLAERIRALGKLAPTTAAALLKKADVDDAKADPSAKDMIDELVASHEKISRRLRRLVEVAEGGGDMVTEDLATERAAFHEKAAWMLKSLAVQ